MYTKDYPIEVKIPTIGYDIKIANMLMWLNNHNIQYIFCEYLPNTPILDILRDMIPKMIAIDIIGNKEDLYVSFFFKNEADAIMFKLACVG